MQLNQTLIATPQFIIGLSQKELRSQFSCPGVAATKALDELGHLECWVIKQADLTSSALGDLLPEEKITRQAMLQNCAAIDFLLLAHGRGCQDFEGKCCFNLSSKSESIHATLDKMNILIKNIKYETHDWFQRALNDTIKKLTHTVGAAAKASGGWLKQLFNEIGLPEWGTSLIRDLGLVVLFLFFLPVVFFVMKRIIPKSFLQLVRTGEVWEVHPQ